MLSPDAAGNLKARIQLEMDGETYFWIRKKGEVRIGRGALDDPDLILRGSPSQIAGYVYAGAPLSSVEFDGDVKLAARLPSLFPMPEKALLATA
jgi:hypothetical protein